MRQTRFMTLLFMLWSLAFFFVPDFRQGLQMGILAAEDWKWLFRAGTLGPSVLEPSATFGEQQRDAKTLAFVALHSSNEKDSFRLAAQAVAIDPQLTWIYYSLVGRNRRNPEAEQWIARLEAWDPQNALPYFLEAEQIRERRGGSWPPPQKLDDLAKETAWRKVMEKAYAAPHYDSYVARRFELERVWLRRHGLGRPAVVILSLVGYPIPNLLNIRTYAMLLVNKLGKEAEGAGSFPEASGYYRTVAHFGQQMQLEGATLIEKLIGAAVTDIAYGRLLPLLRKTGRVDEAATVDYSNKELHQQLDILHGKDPLAQSSNYNWAALTVHFFAGLVAVFSLFTLVLIGYFTLKRWVRPERKGRVYQFFSVAENYVPILLFLSCLGMYFSYYPYAENLRYYLTAQGEIHNLEPLFYNVLPAFGMVPGHVALPPTNPFRPYVWYALAGLVVAVSIFLLSQRRPSQEGR